MNTVNELKRNGSGYYDPTAYEALRKYEREVNAMEILRGEVWEVELTNGNLKTALVISADSRKNNRWLSILMLSEESRGTNVVQIKADALMYADCDRISFAESHKFNKFIRKATAEEMELIDKSLMGALGLVSDQTATVDNAVIGDLSALADSLNEQKENLMLKLEGAERDIDEKNAEIADLCEKLKVTRAENRKLFEENTQLSATAYENSRSEKDAIKLMTERDLYKQQYETLLEKMIAR